MSSDIVVSMPGSPLVVRPLGLHDVPSILAIQQLAYEPRYLESAEAFAAKIEAGGQCCFGAFSGSVMVGYLVCVPLPEGGALPLDSATVPQLTLADGATIYIHDLAVHPDHRGAGVGDLLLVHLYDTAVRHRISTYRLVAVQNSTAYWLERGFTVETAPIPEGYGPEAVLMSRR